MDLMDEENSSLILQIQLQDSHDLFEASKGKGKARQGTLSDYQLSLQLYNQELERGSTLLKDRQLTRSIARACQTDGQLLLASEAQEQAAVRDRQAALQLGGVAPQASNVQAVNNPLPAVLDDRTMASLESLWVQPPQVMRVSTIDHAPIAPAVAESSSWAASRRPRQPVGQVRKCVACQEDVLSHITARTECDHDYCQECLLHLFRASMTDESLFPPQCCRNTIEISSVRNFLPQNLIEEYREKKIEYETPDKTYCSNRHCSIFIKPDYITGERARCSRCSTLTCTVCKGAGHTGDCPTDTALHQVLQVAQQNGWQRCFSCRRVVELEIGCNHMT